MRSIDVPAAVAIDDADRHLRAQPAAERQAVLAGHGDVEDGEMEGLRRDELAHGGGVSTRDHVIAVGAEILGDGVPQVGLVLDNGNPWRAVWSGLRCRRKVDWV